MKKYSYWGGYNSPPDHLLTENQMRKLGYQVFPKPSGYIIHTYDNGQTFVTIYLYELKPEFEVTLKLLFDLDYPYIIQIEDRLFQDLLKNPDLFYQFNEYLEEHFKWVVTDFNCELFYADQMMYQNPFY